MFPIALVTYWLRVLPTMRVCAGARVGTLINLNPGVLAAGGFVIWRHHHRSRHLVRPVTPLQPTASPGIYSA